MTYSSNNSLFNISKLLKYTTNLFLKTTRDARITGELQGNCKWTAKLLSVPQQIDSLKFSFHTL